MHSQKSPSNRSSKGLLLSISTGFLPSPVVWICRSFSRSLFCFCRSTFYRSNPFHFYRSSLYHFYRSKPFRFLLHLPFNFYRITDGSAIIVGILGFGGFSRSGVRLLTRRIWCYSGRSISGTGGSVALVSDC